MTEQVPWASTEWFSKKESVDWNKTLCCKTAWI